MLRMLTIVTFGLLMLNLGGTAFAGRNSNFNPMTGTVSLIMCPAHMCGPKGGRKSPSMGSCSANNCKKN
jgi:hypothetical protein